MSLILLLNITHSLFTIPFPCFEMASSSSSWHILVVDDDATNRKYLEKLLTFSSYKVTCLDSVDMALGYLGLLKPTASTLQQTMEGLNVDLILTDFDMGKKTGYNLLQRVKESKWSKVPVVVMSSENVPSRIKMCLEGGAQEFLIKPVRQQCVKKLEVYMMKSASSGN